MSNIYKELEARGKPLALVIDSLKLHFEEVDYQNWLADKQAEYDSLFKTVYTPEFIDEEGNVITEAVTELAREYIKPDVTELVEEYLSSKYKKQRANEYPELPEQLDMLYKDITNGTTNWIDLISSIKSKYPKVI